MPKEIGGEKNLNFDADTVTDFFDGCNGGTVVPTADDVVQGGLCDSADGSEFVYGNLVFCAKFKDAKSDCHTYIHAATSIRM